MKQSEFPAGWDEERVCQVIAHYEQQTEEEAVAEDEMLKKTLSVGEIDEIVVAQADDGAAWEPAVEQLNVRTDSSANARRGAGGADSV